MPFELAIQTAQDTIGKSGARYGYWNRPYRNYCKLSDR